MRAVSYSNLTNMESMFDDPMQFFSAVELSANAQLFELKESVGVLDLDDVKWEVKRFGQRVMLRAWV